MGPMKVKSKMKKTAIYRGIGIAGALFVPALAIAAFTVPNTFVAETVISASAMNQNFDAVASELELLQARLDALESGDTEWTDAVLGNDWDNHNVVSGVYPTAAFRKDADGIVHFRGIISGGVDQSVAFTLPTGYYPSKTTSYVVSSGPGVGRISIDADGDVIVWYTEASTAYVYLDSVSFHVD